MVGRGGRWEGIPHDQPARSGPNPGWAWMPGCGSGCEITFSPAGWCLVAGCPWPLTALLASAWPGSRCCRRRGDTPRPSHAYREALGGGFEAGTLDLAQMLFAGFAQPLSSLGGGGRPGLAWALEALSSRALGRPAPSVYWQGLRGLGLASAGTLPTSTTGSSISGQTNSHRCDCQMWPKLRRERR